MVTTGIGTTDSSSGASPSGGAGAGPARRRKIPGGLVTIGTVAALVAAMGLTVLGLGAADDAVASYDASSWLWSTARSELARVNGVTARVDTRTEVPRAQGHTMQVSQTDQMVLLRDLNTGQVSALDLATLQITATSTTTAGLGVNVALDRAGAFVVDAVQGVVGQLDPRSLQPVGEPIHYPPGITGGAFDGAGQLWIAVPSEGTVSAITPAALPSAGASQATATAGLSPKLVRTMTVAAPNHDLALSTLDDGVAVLDRTTSTLTTVHGTQQRAVPLTLTGPGSLPARTSGSQVPVTVADDRHVVVVDGDGAVRKFAVPGTGGTLTPAVAWAGLFYCADTTGGVVYAFDATGHLVDTITNRNANGPLELEVREDHLFINAPNSATAQVVDDNRKVTAVDKYANDVLGGDPPPVAPPPPPPKKPVVSAPSAPRNVIASAGDASARVSWKSATANGAAITRYVVTGAGRSVEVGANQRSVEVSGLTNGQTYRFAVHAVNRKGAGPDRSSNPVVPTADVPDAPASVTAEERPDGTVRVTWPAANGQGRKITKYAVTAVAAGSTAPAGESPRTELVIPAGELDYGTQYAFTVVAVNDRGAGSTPSPVSNSVVPFTVPGAPQPLTAATVAGKAGTVSVTWAVPPDNGRPISGYTVEAAGRKSQVTGTSTTLTGLGDGQNVQVKVQAVNDAGTGPAATATARTVAAPQVTVTGSSADVSSATVTFTVDAGGGQATCTLTPSGRPAVTGSCSSIRATGLTAGTSYTFTVTASNAAGSGKATRAQATDVLWGTATCNNGPSGDQRTYCDNDRDGRNGNEIFSVPQQVDSKQVGWAKPGTRLRTYCKKQGGADGDVDAWIYNSKKHSTWWIQIDYDGKKPYIPWAWLNLDSGDNLNLLPDC